MNPRTRFFRGVAVIGALGIGLAACEDTNVVIPETPTISATPASMTLEVGQTRQIVATLTNLDGGINYQSDNPSVATVSAAGVVTGVGEGSATITVSAANQPTLQTGVDVNVVPSELPPTEEASVSIQSITVGNTTIPVNPAAVVNVIALSLNVQRGEADELRVFAGDIEVESCRQTFAAADAPAQITAEDLSLAQGTTVICSINTAAFNISNGQGVPVYANGAYAFRAELRDDGTVIDSAESAPHTFNNADFTVVNLEAPNSQVSDLSGLLWHSGAVSVTAIPVLFTGAPVASVTFSYGALPPRTDSTPADGFTTTYNTSGANNIGGLTDAGFNVTTTSVRENGQPGPTGNSNASLPAGVAAFRVDNEGPDGGVFVLTDQDTDATGGITLCCRNNWVGAAYEFADGKTGEVDLNSGVGLPATGSVTFHVGAAALSDDALAALAPVTGGADLDETDTNTDLRAVAVVKDKLGNTTIVPLAISAANPQEVDGDATLGVDKTAPTLAFDDAAVVAQSAADLSINPTDEFEVLASDDRSGFDAPNHVLARLIRLAPNLTSQERCALGSHSAISGNCSLDGMGTTLTIPVEHGYFTVEATVVDQAGNLSHPLAGPLLSRLVLVDTDVPTLGPINVPLTLTGGTSTAFAMEALDNVNLFDSSLRIVFGAEALPFAPNQSINAQFPAALVSSTTVNQSAVFVKSLETTDAGHAPSTGLQPATDIRYLVRDAALNEADQTTAIPGAVAAGLSFADATRNVSTFQVMNGVQNVCNGGTGCAAGTPTSRTVSVQATGPSGTFANPFQTVHLYYRDGGGIVRYIGAAGAATLNDTGAERIWTWTVTFSAIGIPQTANIPVFAVGVHSSGDALITNDNTNISVVGTL